MGVRAVAILVWAIFLFRAPAAGQAFADLAARANAARLANDVPRAIDLYREALRLNPQWPEGWLYLGTLLYGTDQYAGCRDALSRFVSLQENVAPAWGLLGLCEFETREYGRALAEIQRSLAAGPIEDPQMEVLLRFDEAVLLAHAGAFEQALRKYAWFVRQAVPPPALLLAMGTAALREPGLPKDINSERRGLFEAAGKAAFFAASRNSAEAENALRELLERYPGARGVHCFYGYSVLGTAPSVAMAEFRRELQIDPSSAAARAMLAWALLNQGEGSAAVTEAGKAVHDAPDLPVAQYALGRALAETGDVAKGIAHLENAVTLDAGDLEIHLALASAYSKSGRTAEARRERKRSVELVGGAAAVARP